MFNIFKKKKQIGDDMMLKISTIVLGALILKLIEKKIITEAELREAISKDDVGKDWGSLLLRLCSKQACCKKCGKELVGDEDSLCGSCAR